MSKNFESGPPKNYELQAVGLLHEHKIISHNLFTSGAVLEIIEAADQARGVITDVADLAQLNKLFVPSVRGIKVEGWPERILSLAVVTSDAKEGNVSYIYFDLGMMDDAGMFYPYPHVPAEAASAVHVEAAGLASLRGKEGENGILPNLSTDLLRIDNPNTAMMRTKPPH